MKKTILSLVVMTLVAFGLLVAQAGAKKREFNGNIDVQVYQKDASNLWKVVDEIHISSAHFITSVSDIAAGKKSLASDFAFSGTTVKGKAVTVRLKAGGKGDVDLTTGFLGLDLPFEITISGKKADAALKLTTDSAQGANGPISGRRARINTAAHTADLALVGSVTIVSPVVLSQGPSFTPGTADQKAEQKGEKGAERADNIAAGAKSQEALLVVKGSGTLKALD